ncbi:MAG: NERD domain-containing protein [Mariprofundaceae bacterium]|nr:NERD domain-containing protein [Mariprofundaceae bacterium]
MDVIQIIPAAAPVILGVLSVILLTSSTWFARPWLAGVIGKARIERELNLLRKKGATVLNNLLLADNKGEVIHIDHLIITNAQIFAISTLGYSGEILGSVRGATWIQETRQGSHRFPNPARHHEAIRNLLHGILGERLKVRTVSAFTAGRLQGDATDEVVSARECARAMHAAVEGLTTGTRQQWAGNIIRNVLLKNNGNTAITNRAFVSRQGNEKYLKAAQYMMTGSALLMLLAIIMAGLRLAANHGVI